MRKKPPERRPTLLESRIFNLADIAQMKAEGYKAIVSAAHQDADAWKWHKKAVSHDNARNPARDKAEAEALRIAEGRWAEGSMTITAMTEFVTAELARTGFGTWSEKAVRGWIRGLAPSHKPGRPRDE